LRLLEILLDDKQGNVWDISSIVSEFTWKTSRIGKPGSVTFTLLKNGMFQDTSFHYNNGDIIRCRDNGQNVFFGYVFSVEESQDEDVKSLCYDQIRYLMASDTYVFTNVTASQVLQRIANDFNLKLGQIDDTGYRIPAMAEDGQKLLDIICKALTLTLNATGKNYFLFDDFGVLSLRDSNAMTLDFMLGDNSLMTGFDVKRSIDDDTYNRIKLYQDNKATGKREVYITQDSANIAKWGTLQLYQSVDENWNAGQINELLNQLAKLKNRESKTLKMDAIGDIRVRAGVRIHILIQEYGVDQALLVDECSHKFDGDEHTMSLELKVI
jgi:hypothetical protein